MGGDEYVSGLDGSDTLIPKLKLHTVHIWTAFMCQLYLNKVLIKKILDLILKVQ